MPTNVFPSQWPSVAGIPFPTVSDIGLAQGAPLANNGASFGPDSINPLTRMPSTTGGQAECDAYLVSVGGGLGILVNGQALEITPSAGNVMLTPYELGSGVSAEATWVLLQGGPELTVSSTGSLSLPNGGCNFGPQTPGTFTTGVNEALVDQMTVGLPVKCLPGTFTASNPGFEVPYKDSVMRGAGNYGATATSLYANFQPSPAGPGFTYIYSPTVESGHYFGFFEMAFNNHYSYTYGCQMSTTPGGAVDQGAASFLWEFIRMGGSPTFTGTGSVPGQYLMFDGWEDGLAFQLSGVGTSAPNGISWQVNGGSAKILGGNYYWIHIPSLGFEVSNAVYSFVTVGHPTAKGKIYIMGGGGGGGTSSFGPPLVTGIVVGDPGTSSGNYTYLTTEGTEIIGNGSNVGFINGPLAANLVLNSHGDKYSTPSATCPLFGYTTSAGTTPIQGCAFLDGAMLNGGTVAQLLGLTPPATTTAGWVGGPAMGGAFISGVAVPSGGGISAFQNGYIRSGFGTTFSSANYEGPVGAIPYPFGTAVPFWQGPSIAVMAPGFSSAAGSATPTSGTTYTVAYTPIWIGSITGGTTVSITIADPFGNAVVSAASSIASPGVVLQPGYTITISYSGAPTVKAYGA